MLDSQLIVNAALVDAEKKLIFIYSVVQGIESFHLLLASYKPSCSPFAGLFGIFVGRGIFNALVKSHCNC